MTQTNINVIGLIIIAAVFYYFQIYRPKKLRANPQDLEVKKLSQQHLKLADIAARHFAEKYFVLNQPRFEDLFYSPSLSKNAIFRKHMLGMKSDVVLVDKESHLPVLAMQLETKGDEEKQNYINGAGLGCLVFTHVDDEEETVKSIIDALLAIQVTDTAVGDLSPA